jgi:2-polyprenyl-3-methyl-5-hydroxy-6-metoxy-1,4-benzoquinol methylase
MPPSSLIRDKAVGVDVSREMIRQAKAGGAEVENILFVHDSSPDLMQLGPGTFDVVLSLLVLQHFPAVSAIACSHAAGSTGRWRPSG